MCSMFNDVFIQYVFIFLSHSMYSRCYDGVLSNQMHSRVYHISRSQLEDSRPSLGVSH